MAKSFEHKQVNELISFYKDVTNGLTVIEDIKKQYKNLLVDKSNFLVKTGYFADLIEKEFRNKFDNEEDESLNDLIASIHYYIEAAKNTKDADVLYNMYLETFEQHIKNLSSATNSIFWFFTSQKKKALAEESYNVLCNEKNGFFVEKAKELINKNKNIKNISLSEIKTMFSNNPTDFQNGLLEANKNIADIIGKELLFEKECNEYLSVLEKLNSIKNALTSTTKEAKKHIEFLLAEELVNTLRGIPVDELSRGKTGLKIKYLKDGGYENLADVFGSSRWELASVYGISDDASYTIKKICDDYALKIRKEQKIKLTVDNKTVASTNVVVSLLKCIKIEELLSKTEELNRDHEKNTKRAINGLKKLGNGVNWIFLSRNKKEKEFDTYEHVKHILNNVYKPIVDSVFYDFYNMTKTPNEAWAKFNENPIKFYNVIEEILPGVLGTDDSIYGLPEELARKVQEECLFPDGLLCTLRKYQEWGVKYILHQEKVLLGDEMGLGKTVQAIATMVSLKNTGATHFLVVCPASVVTNWCREIQKHSRLKVTKIHGKGKQNAFKSWIKSGGVAVTNFESTSYIQLEEDFKFSMLIVDEAHYIKNAEAQRSKNTRNLTNFTDRVLFMTGTALENNVDEMISLIDVLQPDIAKQISSVAFLSSSQQFREKVVPVYYRRKREDVLTELPDKIETKEWCVLNKEEEEVYENAILDSKYQQARRVSWSVDDLNLSSKASRLKEIIEEAEKEGRKVLVFSYFLDTIAKIHEFLRGRCLNPITGSVNVNRRQEIIDEFDKAPAGTVLLAQINSGGTGLNIQSASVVVICEPQFKPSIENQAISRAYRMGQARKVLVYRLLCENTIDERIVEILEEKQQIFDAFADKSIAGQKSLEVDETTFGDIIKEEIDRINKKRGIKTNGNIQVLNFKETENKDYYQKIMNFTYDELVQHLLDKYGPAEHDYFMNESCSTKNQKVTRTAEGLYCHHIDEDKAVLLSNDAFASRNPFEYQKANRLVYCNLLEHFLLHILIAEEPKKEGANEYEIQGIGGAVCYISKQLNDLYNGYIFKQEWLINTTSKVKGDYQSYIMMLKRLWKLVKNDKRLRFLIKKEDLAKGYDGTVYPKILAELDF